ncbi:MAG TPA: hypothetical protein PK987_03290 [Ferruginibacter sp.]|nr:hypothetical protein [Ferruginibacter sp.]
MKNLILNTLTLMVIIFISGCSTSKSTNSNSNNNSKMLYNSQWILSELNGTTGNTGNAKLFFLPGKVTKVSGNAGCNIIR